MITLTLAAPGWTWRHNDEERRWELGFYNGNIIYGPWGKWVSRTWITDECIEGTEPAVLFILLQEFARAAVQSKERA